MGISKSIKNKIKRTREKTRIVIVTTGKHGIYDTEALEVENCFQIVVNGKIVWQTNRLNRKMGYVVM